jgi:hypothetical protein
MPHGKDRATFFIPPWPADADELGIDLGGEQALNVIEEYVLMIGL